MEVQTLRKLKFANLRLGGRKLIVSVFRVAKPNRFLEFTTDREIDLALPMNAAGPAAHPQICMSSANHVVYQKLRQMQ